MKIYRVTDPEFKRYGRILKLDADEIIAAAEKIPMPEDGSLYEASTEVFEKLSVYETVKNECFGEMPTQIGYCWGYNSRLNALEWHKGSEVNIAVTDFVLMLGRLSELEPGARYNSENIRAFLVKKGETIEVYAETMHFCPCMTSEKGFGCVVALPKGTNTELEAAHNDKLLFKKNKWIIAHEQNKQLISRGICGGIYGENYNLSE